jgi:hypothetical protein
MLTKFNESHIIQLQMVYDLARIIENDVEQSGSLCKVPFQHLFGQSEQNHKNVFE